MLYFIPLLIKILKLERFECRGLTAGEIELCRPVFGSLIDYSQVKIMNHPYLPWQARHVIMAPCGAIHARPPNYSRDYSAESSAFQGLFIHEMAHIYQYQQKIHVLLRGAILQSSADEAMASISMLRHHRLALAQPLIVAFLLAVDAAAVGLTIQSQTNRLVDALLPALAKILVHKTKSMLGGQLRTALDQQPVVLVF